MPRKEKDLALVAHSSKARFDTSAPDVEKRTDLVLDSSSNSTLDTTVAREVTTQGSASSVPPLPPHLLTSAVVPFHMLSPSVANPLADDTDGGAVGGVGGGGVFSELENQRVKTELAHLQQKITKTKDQIKEEQTSRDENVNEYLKLATQADKQQLTRIKAVFEKKNQKSALTIAHLQKKLETYTKRLKEVELYGVSSTRLSKSSGGVLRDMGHGLKHVGGNIRDGISGFSGSVMSKPREFAHLIKNKFGSADNINSLNRGVEDRGSADDGHSRSHHGSSTLPPGITMSIHPPADHPHASSTPSASGGNTGSAGEGMGVTGSGGGSDGAVNIKFVSDDSECSSVTSESLPLGNNTHSSPGRRPVNNQINSSPHHNHTAANNLVAGSSCSSLDPFERELHQRREDVLHLREEIESIKLQFQQELMYMSQALQEERYRSERLEEQINDLTELHQNEVENLKQCVTDMEEKVQYQSEERLRDIHELLESCQTKVSRMEHQQQQQQYVSIEGLENSQARALVVKLVNILLTLLQVILLLVATVAGIIMPFLKTRLRILTTLVIICTAVFVLGQWPELKDIGHHLIRKYREMISTVK